MKRCSSKTPPRRPSEPITTLVIEGRWRGRRLPGSACFVANCRMLARSYRARPRRRRHLPAIALFATLERESIILDSLRPDRHKIVAVLLRLASYSRAWVRPIEDWRPASASGGGQLSELIRFLFERYPAPEFFHSAWHLTRRRRFDWTEFAWYLHVARGASIRTAPDLPVRLSPRAAHEVAAAPAALSPRQALRWGQIRAAGVPPQLAHAILATPAGADFQNDALWLPFFEKLAHQPTLQAEQVGPLVDYVAHRARAADRGVFSFKGRTIAGLLRAMERWHQELVVRRYADLCAADGAADKRWDAVAGVSPLCDERDGDLWQLTELCSARELCEEACRMRHCVPIYCQSCLAGVTSIWSLRTCRLGRERARVTIRLDVTKRAIVEARGPANTAIAPAEHAWIKYWARINGLEVMPIPTRAA
jgi:hypothetical protein